MRKARGRSADGDISAARIRGAACLLAAVVRAGGEGGENEDGGSGTKGSEVSKPEEEGARVRWARGSGRRKMGAAAVVSRCTALPLSRGIVDRTDLLWL